MKTKDRPILFSAPMVRALLDGSKTQTRRVAPITDLNIKPHSNDTVTWGVSFSKPIKGVYGSHSGGRFSDETARRIIASQFCPHGKPGDQLWVRETYWIDDEDSAIIYRADKNADIVDTNRHETGSTKYNWKPSIFMPRAASRITLDITGVRVERLQDISEADAAAEGVSAKHTGDAHYTAREAYAVLWESINGPGSWDLNPWVWVIEFKKASQ